jgi:hypothetical protein
MEIPIACLDNKKINRLFIPPKKNSCYTVTSEEMCEKLMEGALRAEAALEDEKREACQQAKARPPATRPLAARQKHTLDYWQP